MFRKTLFTLITILVTLVLCFVIGEIATRFLDDAKFQITADERNTLYKFDEELGWFSIENIEEEFQGSRSIHVKNNDLGFRDINHGPKTKQRIAFVGDSFVWGYDVEQEERFTEKLQARLPDWEVINMGISGYGTDQEYLLLEKWFDHFQPDVVVTVFCNNDWDDNKMNRRYGGYYKPHFLPTDNGLVKQGTPVPKGINYYSKQYPLLFKSRLIHLVFKLILPKSIWMEGDSTIMLINAMKEYVNEKGAYFALAFANDETCSFCESSKIQPLFLQNNFVYGSHGNHWTPEGHDFVTDKIHDFLIQKGIVDSLGAGNKVVIEN